MEGGGSHTNDEDEISYYTEKYGDKIPFPPGFK